MNSEFKNRHSDDPNSLTTEDREVLKKKILSSTDIKDALNEYKTGEPLVPVRHFSETAPKLILGILMVISGIIIAVVTSISIIGIVIGAALVLAGIALPFSNIGARRGSAV
jgi:hypothetical protein